MRYLLSNLIKGKSAERLYLSAYLSSQTHRILTYTEQNNVTALKSTEYTKRINLPEIGTNQAVTRRLI